MNEFLTSIGYTHWMLPVLLVVPTLGAIAIWLQGLPGGAARRRRRGRGHGHDAAHDRPRHVRRRVRDLARSLVVLRSRGRRVAGRCSSIPWIPSWGIRFTLGIDGISLMMVLLTTFMMLLAVLGSWTSIRKRAHSYYALLLILTTGMLGVFMALDLFLFYVMWEVMLVPMYFIIGVWGGERRLYASLKFFIYTMVGSLLMLVAIVYLGLASASRAVTGIPNFSYDAILATCHAHADRRALAVRRLLPGVRREGADVPVPHLAARRARRGADGGLGDPGRASC